MQILKGITNITIKPIQHIDFTNKYEPIPFPGIDVGEGISGVINTLGEAGNKILDTGSNLIKNVVQTERQSNKSTVKNNYHRSMYSWRSHNTFDKL